MERMPESNRTSEQGRERARRNVKILMGEKEDLGSAAALARAAGISPDTVADFLSGARWPRMETRRAIEDALGIEPETIQGWAEGREPDRPPQVEPTLRDASDLDLVLALLERIRSSPRSS